MSTVIQNKAFYVAPAGVAINVDTAFTVANDVVVMFSTTLADVASVTIAGTVATKIRGNDTNSRYCSIWTARVLNASRTDVVFTAPGLGIAIGSITEVNGLAPGGSFINATGISGDADAPAYAQTNASITQSDVVAFGCWIDCSVAANETSDLEAGWSHAYDGGGGVPAGGGGYKIIVGAPLTLVVTSWDTGFPPLSHAWRAAMVAFSTAMAPPSGDYAKPLMFGRI